MGLVVFVFILVLFFIMCGFMVCEIVCNFVNMDWVEDVIYCLVDLVVYIEGQVCNLVIVVFGEVECINFVMDSVFVCFVVMEEVINYYVEMLE